MAHDRTAEEIFPAWWRTSDAFSEFPALRKVCVHTYVPACYCPKRKQHTDHFVKLIGESEDALKTHIKGVSTSITITFERELNFEPLL